MAKVFDLNAERPPVKLLEEVLEQAKTGRFKAVIFLGLEQDEGVQVLASMAKLSELCFMRSILEVEVDNLILDSIP